MKAVPRRRRHALRVTLIALFTALASVTLAAGTTSVAVAAPAQNDGFVRLAHLSPDTPTVDVYLNAVSYSMKQQVFPGVSYGTVSAYLPLPAGRYAVSMRLAGASPTSDPVIGTSVTVQSGHAYTVAGVGKNVDLGLKVIPDDLSSPLNGKAMVRIVQASIKAPLINVSLDGGQTVATNVPFATTTSYESVASGNWTMRVGASTGGASYPVKVELKPDSVYSVLVIDGKGSLTVQLRTDAQSQGTTPVGGVASGGGGMTRHQLVTPTLYVAIGAIILMLALILRRRPRERWSAKSGAPTVRLPSRTL